MDEINLKELSRFFLKRIYIMGVIVVFFCLGGVIFTLSIQKPMYQSSITILLTKTDGDNSTITQSDILLNQKLITTYREIVKSNKVLKRVISDLGLNYSVGELSKSISVSSVKDTEIIKITVSDLKSENAMHIANKTADIFSMEIKNLYKIQNIGVIDAAEVSNSPYNVQPVKQILLATFVGIVMSMIVMFIIYYFDTTIKSVEQVEEVIKLPVIGKVPLKKVKRMWGR